MVVILLNDSQREGSECNHLVSNGLTNSMKLAAVFETCVQRLPWTSVVFETRVWTEWLVFLQYLQFKFPKQSREDVISKGVWSRKEGNLLKLKCVCLVIWCILWSQSKSILSGNLGILWWLSLDILILPTVVPAIWWGIVTHSSVSWNSD